MCAMVRHRAFTTSPQLHTVKLMSLKFSEVGEKKFQEIVGRYPSSMAALLPSLLLAQSEFGWVSVEVMDYLAERLDLHPAKVLSTATFYTMVNKQPVGKCHVQVCTTLTCALRGAYELIDDLEEQLGVRLGETSADGKWTLVEAECLAACGTAPMFQVTFSDGEIVYYEDLARDKPERLQAVLRELNEKLKSLPQPSQMH